MTIRRVVRLIDPADVAEVVAQRLLDTIVDLQSSRDEVHLCLTGGDTANLMYERFASLAPGSNLDPTRIHLWWGDERFVPGTDPVRNSLQAIARLARTMTLRPDSIHMMAAQDGRADSHESAEEYERELGEVYFDVTLLGIGIDGHVASIFPDHPSFDASSRQVIGVTNSPKPPAERISLSLERLSRSAEIWFMATGASKGPAVARVLDEDMSLPAAHPHGSDATYWFLDATAASELPPSYKCAL
ncbi:MAG: 6-phosphogluconolactonase [Arachnia sp.]